ncbi:hypothetical protein ACTXT7_009034 [Hymenolepis weldensis]
MKKLGAKPTQRACSNESGLPMVSAKVGGVPEVLPPHIMRLSPVGASKLASTLANAIEEVRLQWLKRSQEGSLSRSLSQEAVYLKGQPARHIVRHNDNIEISKKRRNWAANGAGLEFGCPRVQPTLSPCWLPASV